MTVQKHNSSCPHLTFLALKNTVEMQKSWEQNGHLSICTFSEVFSKVKQMVE